MAAEPNPDWYLRKDELCSGQVFRCQGGVVKLDCRVPGDGTKWEVLDWHNGWCWYGCRIEPGDLEGEPMPDDPTIIETALRQQ